MSDQSSIEWTDATWNPVSGCTRVSAGCDSCYAVTMTNRLEAMGQHRYAGLTVLNGNGDRHFNGKVRTDAEALTVPLKWKKPRRIFVNSMSDLFHRDVPFEFIDKVFAVMALCPHHTFQVLTKRPERMAEYLNCKSRDLGQGPHLDTAFAIDAAMHEIAEGPYSFDECNPKCWPLPNVWLGTSVEDHTAAHRIYEIRGVPAAVRFLSLEPLLGPLAPLSLKGIRWVIVGGESGPAARPMHPDWARSIRDQCIAAGVAFHFKQWGEWSPIWAWAKAENVDPLTGRHAYPGEHMGPKGLPVQNENTMFRVGKKAAGRLLDGRTWDQFPKVRR